MPADAHVPSPRLVRHLAAGDHVRAGVALKLAPPYTNMPVLRLEHRAELQMRRSRNLAFERRDAAVVAAIGGLQQDTLSSTDSSPTYSADREAVTACRRCRRLRSESVRTAEWIRVARKTPPTVAVSSPSARSPACDNVEMAGEVARAAPLRAARKFENGRIARLIASPRDSEMMLHFAPITGVPPRSSKTATQVREVFVDARESGIGGAKTDP
jgi:hypothetical protein